MTVDEAIGKWQQALGGSLLEGVSAVRQRMSVQTGGLAGNAEDWQRVSGERRLTVDLGGVYSETNVFDGRVGWRKDQSGAVRELAAHELEAERTLSYLGSFSHLFRGRLPGEVSYLGEQGGFHVFEVKPESGRTAKVFLDVETFLPSKQEEVAGDRVQTLNFTDWRDVEGVKFPFATRQSMGDPKYDVLFHVQEVRLNEVFDDALFTEPPRTTPPLLSEASVSVPFELSSNHIYITGQVGDSRPLNILIDTGASFSVMNSRTARELGLEEVGQLEARGGGDGSQDTGIIEGVTLTLDTLSLADLTLWSIDLTPLEGLEGRTLDLILGYEFISRAVLEIDYEGNLLTFHAPESFSYRGPRHPRPLYLAEQHPHIHAEVVLEGREPVEGVFMVDTGARMALYLNRLFAEQHGVKETVPKVLELPARVSGVGGASRSSVARISGLHLGGLELEDILVSLSEKESGSLETDDLAGLIGGDLLKRFRAVFDYGRQEMILEPNTALGLPFVYDMSGLRLMAEGENFETIRVQTVLTDSPAERAGVLPGDVLERIDETSVGGSSLDDVREQFMQEGQVWQLRLRRGNDVLDVALELEPLV